jgi:hypothetical protein
MHLHGFNMYLLHDGVGEWNVNIIHEENPHPRDVHLLRPNGQFVMQFDAAENPGEAF